MSIEDFIISNELTIFDSNQITKAIEVLGDMNISYIKLKISEGRCIKVRKDSIELIECIKTE